MNATSYRRKSKRITESADVKVCRWPLRLLCTASTLGVSYGSEQSRFGESHPSEASGASAWSMCQRNFNPQGLANHRRFCGSRPTNN